jgi:hypothetical protein
MMLVGIFPPMSSTGRDKDVVAAKKHDGGMMDNSKIVGPEAQSSRSDLTRRQNIEIPTKLPMEERLQSKFSGGDNSKSLLGPISILHSLLILSVLLDFSGCIFANIGLSMAGSGVYQVVYSSVVCWSALMSRVFLNKFVSRVRILYHMVNDMYFLYRKMFYHIFFNIN